MTSTEELKNMIYSFRVSELQDLLGYAGRNKTGKKQELQARALDLLKLRSAPVQIKILELHKRRFQMMEPPPSSKALQHHQTRQSTAVPQGQSTAALEQSSMSSRSNGIVPAAGSGVNYAGSSSGMAYSSSPVKSSLSLINPGPSTSRASVYPYHPDVKFKELPFFDVLAVLLQPSSLSPSSNSGYQESHFQFHLSPQQVQDITSSRVYSSVTNSTGEHAVQIQLRFCLLESSCEQDDNFPPSICVKVNGRTCSLPNPVPTNRPGVEPKRPSRPVNITHLCRMSATTSNNLTISWASDFSHRAYVSAVFLVRRLDSSILLSRLRSKGMRNPDHTRGMIKEKLEQGPDSEIATTSLRGSLMCPIGKMKMQIPCRPVTCTHLQCFDANLFLKMNEKKPRWICPVCDNAATFSSLAIDGLFSEISAKAPSCCTEVQFHEDGSWTPIIQETETHDIDSSFQENESKQQKKRPESTEVVDLTSDVEDDDWSMPSTSLPGQKPPKMFKSSASASSSMYSSSKMQSNPAFISLPSPSSGSSLPSYSSIPGTSSSGININEGASTSMGSPAFTLPHTLMPPAAPIVPDVEQPQRSQDVGYNQYGVPYINPPYYSVSTPSPTPSASSSSAPPQQPTLSLAGISNPRLYDNDDDFDLYSLLQSSPGNEKPPADDSQSANSTPDIISLD